LESFLLVTATLGGAAITGLLLIWSQHFQATLADRRERRDREREVRSERLERIKHLIDSGANILARLDWASGARNIPPPAEDIQQFGAALNGALISSIEMDSPSLTAELHTTVELMIQVDAQFNQTIIGRDVIGQVIANLARIQRQYIDLRTAQIKEQPPERPWWW